MLAHLFFFLAGLTVVAWGTSAPELAVSLGAAPRSDTTRCPATATPWPCSSSR